VKPARVFRFLGPGGLLDQEGEEFRLQHLPLGEHPVRAAPDRTDHVCKFVQDDLLPDVLMVYMVTLLPIFAVQKMPEGTVADIVKKARQAAELNAKMNAWGIGTDGFQRRVEGCHETPRQMHDADRMLKTGMFSCRVNPPGGLKLVNATEPLHPAGINQIFLGDFLDMLRGNRKGDELVDRIAQKTLREELLVAVNGQILSPCRKLNRSVAHDLLNCKGGEGIGPI